uniref:CSON014129 protein n=1 Tax=Culicoides sonorensis TaxID=179676 RepID=A0A336MFF1_CULSO
MSILCVENCINFKDVCKYFRIHVSDTEHKIRSMKCDMLLQGIIFKLATLKCVVGLSYTRHLRIMTRVISLRKGLGMKFVKSSGCTFPSRWEGSWFQSGVPQPIHIKGNMLSNRGKCVASDGDKYLLSNGGCHRCVVIYEKHKNVLQYKESECLDQYEGNANPAPMPMRSILKSDHNSRVGGAHPNMNGHSRLSSSDQFLFINDDSSPGCKNRETLQFLCEQIPGDALLFSMFKENSEPVKCPLKGPFTFTYNRGHGECKNPISNIESCTEDSRLLLSFQACPDVPGTESTVEELTCLATWKDGNARYLVGLVTHHHATSNEERYRCFVYEKIQPSMGGASKDAEYKLAQSGDATCNGLESAEVGSRIMTLRKAQPTERCDFPTWFKGPKHWHALMGNAGYVFHPSDGSMHILKQSGYMETRALCEQINKQTEDEMQAVQIWIHVHDLLST